MTEVEIPEKRRRKRNWRSFGLKTLFVLVTIASIVAALPHLYRRYQIHQFKSFVDQDIRQLRLDQRQELRNFVDILADRPRTGWYDSSEYWRVWQIPTPDGTRFVLLRVFPPNRDRTSTVKIFVLDHHCHMVNESVFTTGYRISLVNAALDHDQFPDAPIIRFDTQRSFNGQDVAKQYYAIVDDQVALLRLEDSQGNLIPNPFTHVGPQAIEQSEAEWKDSLSSPHPTEVLSTLAWLGDSYWHPDAEIDENTPMAIRVKTDPATQAAVAKLTKHEHPWIAEAALYIVREKELEDDPFEFPLPIDQ